MRFWPQSWTRSRAGKADGADGADEAAAAGCREAMRELQTYLDGHLDERAASRIARHLEDCRRCGLEAKVYADIKASLARSDREIPEDTVARLQAFAARLPDQEARE